MYNGHRMVCEDGWYVQTGRDGVRFGYGDPVLDEEDSILLVPFLVELFVLRQDYVRDFLDATSTANHDDYVLHRLVLSRQTRGSHPYHYLVIQRTRGEDYLFGFTGSESRKLKEGRDRCIVIPGKALKQIAASGSRLIQGIGYRATIDDVDWRLYGHLLVSSPDEGPRRPGRVRFYLNDHSVVIKTKPDGPWPELWLADKEVLLRVFHDFSHLGGADSVKISEVWDSDSLPVTYSYVIKGFGGEFTLELSAVIQEESVRSAIIQGDYELFDHLENLLEMFWDLSCYSDDYSFSDYDDDDGDVRSQI